MSATRVAVVMGVSGAGKTTVGIEVARRLGWRFVDADDLHTAAAKAKMARGDGLTDADRAPWLGRVRAVIADYVAGGEGLVVACSALKASYREALASPGDPVRFLWLDVPVGVLRERLLARAGHFAGADLLPSQLAALEAPGGPQTVRLDGSRPLDAVADAAVQALR